MDVFLLLDYSILLHFGYIQADFIPKQDLLVTQGTGILQGENVMKASLVHMVIALDQLKAGVPVDYLSFTEGTVDLWELVILWRWWIGFFKSES